MSLKVLAVLLGVLVDNYHEDKSDYNSVEDGVKGHILDTGILTGVVGMVGVIDSSATT